MLTAAICAREGVFIQLWADTGRSSTASNAPHTQFLVPSAASVGSTHREGKRPAAGLSKMSSVVGELVGTLVGGVGEVGAVGAVGASVAFAVGAVGAFEVGDEGDVGVVGVEGGQVA